MCAELYARCADRVRELMEFQVEICQAESRRLWEDRRQLFLYKIMEELPVNRPEQWICWQKPRDISLTLPKVTRGAYDPSDDYIGYRSV